MCWICGDETDLNTITIVKVSNVMIVLKYKNLRELTTSR